MCVQEFAEEVRVRRSRLPEEPDRSADLASVVLISLRLPSGERLERRFTATNQLQVCLTASHLHYVCVFTFAVYRNLCIGIVDALCNEMYVH